MESFCPTAPDGSRAPKKHRGKVNILVVLGKGPSLPRRWDVAVPVKFRVEARFEELLAYMRNQPLNRLGSPLSQSFLPHSFTYEVPRWRSDGMALADEIHERATSRLSNVRWTGERPRHGASFILLLISLSEHWMGKSSARLV